VAGIVNLAHGDDHLLKDVIGLPGLGLGLAHHPGRGLRIFRALVSHRADLLAGRRGLFERRGLFGSSIGQSLRGSRNLRSRVGDMLYGFSAVTTFSLLDAPRMIHKLNRPTPRACNRTTLNPTAIFRPMLHFAMTAASRTSSKHVVCTPSRQTIRLSGRG